MILDGFQKETPCFHRTISIQIDSPLPQDDTHAVSRQSDVVLNNKSSPNLTFYLTCLWILTGSKNKSPCFHRSILIQINSPLPHDDTQVVSRQSDVELQNKSSPNLTFYLTCLWFWMALKNKSPCFHRPILIQIDRPLPHNETHVVSRQSDVALQNKSSPNLTFYLTCLWFWMALKNKTPCFHRPISIQIDSPLPQDDTQAVSRQSDVVLNSKSSPNLTFYLTCLWFWMALKIKVPASTDQF